MIAKIEKQDIINYPEVYDLNWYAVTHEGYILQFASRGGQFPKTILENWNDLETLDLFFNNLSASSSSLLNPFLKDCVSPKTKIKEYIKYYTIWSNKGLYSFDRTDTSNNLDKNYHLVTYPTQALKFDELPLQIKDILGKTTIHLNLRDLWGIELSQFFEM